MSNQLDNLFYPKSIAVVGASTNKNSLSYGLINNLVNFGYTGCIYPVNPKAEVIHNFKVYKKLTDIKDNIDLAIIMVSKYHVLDTIDECYKKKIQSVVLITAGFRETGDEGANLEKQLLEKIKKYKIRLVGPNCMGITNMKDGVSMNATFVKSKAAKGDIGFISQSGSLGAAVLATVQHKDIGMVQFISIGNKADITENTILEYWKDNDDVKVITIYIESFSDARGFLNIAREVTKSKPVIAIKAARTSAGQKAASSHTGALAGAEVLVDTIFKQSGVIRVDTVEDLFDVAKAFDKTYLPKGTSLGILTNAGGPAILAADEAEKCGLKVANLSVGTVTELKKIAAEEASLGNPVDLLPHAAGEVWERATEIMLQDKGVDSLIVIVGPPVIFDTVEIARKISRASVKFDKTVILVLMSQDENVVKVGNLEKLHPPIFTSVESAVRSVSYMYNYKKHIDKTKGKYIKFDVNKDKVKKILNKYKNENDVYLDFMDVYEILKIYGLPIIDSYLVTNAQQSVDVCEKTGYPVVLKAIGKKLVHKSDVGGVVLNIKNIEELIQNENKIIANLKEKGLDKELEGFLIQPFKKGGIETIFGISRDPKAGHLLMFGTGGIFVEVYKDVNFMLTPVTDVEAEELIKSITGYKILNGIRGSKPVDQKFMKESLLRLSHLVTDFPMFSEIDLNPFVFAPDKKNCKILDARMKINKK